jgi:hypothetical protein
VPELQVELLRSPGCPHAEDARALVLAALDDFDGAVDIAWEGCVAWDGGGGQGGIGTWGWRDARLTPRLALLRFLPTTPFTVTPACRARPGGGLCSLTRPALSFHALVRPAAWISCLPVAVFAPHLLLCCRLGIGP